jgi:hypothetical protein
MWFRLVNAPAWKLGLLYGVYLGIVMGVGGYLQDHELVEHIILGVVSGAVFGAVMGPLSARQNQRAFAATGEELSPAEKELVARAASSRQPLPDDARLQKAAAAVRRRRMEQRIVQLQVA